MTNYASLVTKHAELSSDFGLAYAVRLFGQEAIDSLPVYSKGKNKGKPKGVLNWTTAERGGWTRGGAVQPGLVSASISNYASAGNDGVAVISGMWLGRIQPLSGSRYYLGEEGRAHHARDQAKFAADLEEQRAEWAAERAARVAAQEADFVDSLTDQDDATLNAMADADEYRRCA